MLAKPCLASIPYFGAPVLYEPVHAEMGGWGLESLHIRNSRPFSAPELHKTLS